MFVKKKKFWDKKKKLSDITMKLLQFITYSKTTIFFIYIN